MIIHWISQKTKWLRWKHAPFSHFWDSYFLFQGWIKTGFMFCLCLGYIMVNHSIVGEQMAFVSFLSALSGFWIIAGNKLLLSRWDAAHGSVSSRVGLIFEFLEVVVPVRSLIVALLNLFPLLACFTFDETSNRILPLAASSINYLMMSVQFPSLSPDQIYEVSRAKRKFCSVNLNV